MREQLSHTEDLFKRGAYRKFECLVQCQRQSNYNRTGTRNKQTKIWVVKHHRQQKCTLNSLLSEKYILFAWGCVALSLGLKNKFLAQKKPCLQHFIFFNINVLIDIISPQMSEKYALYNIYSKYHF